MIRRLAPVEQGERVQAAVVLWATGGLSRFDDTLGAALCVRQTCELLLFAISPERRDVVEVVVEVAH